MTSAVISLVLARTVFVVKEGGTEMRIIIRFKSGFELPITCDSFSFTRNPMTNEINEYEIKGIKDNKLIFFRSEDVECVYRDMTSERGDNG